MKLKWIVIPVLIVAVAIYVLQSKGNRDIPTHLIGKWTTPASGYQDRFFKITRETFTYGLGGDKEDVYFISSIKESLEENNILFTISYKNTDGLEFTRSFYYHPENEGVIQFKHQEHIKWTKEKDDAVAENFKTDQKQESRAK
jgi:hypothetical protein